MKIFFDTEFTGLHKNTTLISIGLIAENGKTFYAELTDYDESQVDDWIKKNVIDNLVMKYRDGFYYYITNSETWVKGDKKKIADYLLEWLSQFETVEWVSDVCHYDFVLLIDLLYSHALKMPYGKHNAACHDINQDIAKEFGINEIKAFDKSREEILEVYEVEIDGDKHNALYDAKVIKAIYDNVT